MNTQIQIDCRNHTNSFSAVQSIGIGLCDTQTYQFVTTNSSFFSLLRQYIEPSRQDSYLLDRPFLDYLVSDFAQLLLAALAQVTDTGNSTTLELHMPTNGEEYITSRYCVLEPVFAKQHMNSHVLMTIYEVLPPPYCNLCVLQQQQALSEQRKQEFLSAANHELRTPLAAIQGFAELLHLRLQQDGQLDTQRTLHALTSIIKHSQHLTRLIEDMLDISRLQIDLFSINRSTHNLLSILSQVIEAQALTTHRHTIRYVLDGFTPTDTLPVHVDHDRIIQVFNNLLSNAIKYSPAGGEIEVGVRRVASTTETTEYCLIWVKDHGIGIDPHELPHIFERFHRARNLDRSIPGLGIGLHLAQELISRHQGQIWAESSPGQGSTFYIRLPLCPPA
jgi:signal transduction histidine kinase